ncbi:MAG: hypothetical protein FJ405_18965 [Verrucomicrobia bacterium]|nr:hypothetical protein [Verrucomicrobiota bacterium]
MNKDDRFERFLNAARRGAPKGSPELRTGFATRVAARWASRGTSPDGLIVWERLTRWGLAAGMAVCFAILLASSDSLKPSSNPSALEVFAGLVDEDLL